MKEEKVYSGKDALDKALKKQEGTFPRQVTWLANPPKNTPVKRADTNNNKIAKALASRNPLGQFAKADDDDADDE